MEEKEMNTTCSCENKSQDATCHCQEQQSHECCQKEHTKNHKHKDKKEVDALKQQIAALTEANQTLQQKVQYAQAELINYRKRKEEETTQRLKYANQDLISEMIPLLDNFERAIKLDDNDLTDELSKFLQGFKMMYASLQDILQKFGVEEINCLHQPFDPTTMQALMMDSDPKFQDEEVLDVMLKGYRLKDRVIRAASVKVNKIENTTNNNEKGEDNHE